MSLELIRPRMLEIHVGNGEYIRWQKQRGADDCGQTCLDMLGQRGHERFPTGKLSTAHLAKLVNVGKDVTVFDGQDDQWDYAVPHMVALEKLGEAKEPYHWVIKFRDLIICPTIGVMDALSYQRKYNYVLTVAFKIPFQSEQRYTFTQRLAA